MNILQSKKQTCQKSCLFVIWLRSCDSLFLVNETHRPPLIVMDHFSGECLYFKQDFSNSLIHCSVFQLAWQQTETNILPHGYAHGTFSYWKVEQSNTVLDELISAKKKQVKNILQLYLPNINLFSKYL